MADWFIVYKTEMTMKTKLIFGLLLLGSSITSMAQVAEEPTVTRENNSNYFYHQPNVVEREYNDSTGMYVIRFTYGMFKGRTPVAGDEDEIRYSAYIQVYRIDDCTQKLIGRGFMGTYSPDGCIYDEAGYLISEARKLEDRMISTER